ncbi:MAG: phosphoribosyl 1,2-cyclic phosphodiesterase [Lentimonas sp.]|jgi:phosphoribosyl 1,2-cyclic phosphodiesterase
MKAIIWGACGSLPTPTTPSQIYDKLKNALWSARNEQFTHKADVDAYLETLPRSAHGSYHGNTSCVEIQTAEQDVILCDAGSGLRDYSNSIPSGTAPRTYHIFLSHLHWDHIQGFPFFTPAYIPGNRIILHGVHPTIEAAIRNQMNAPCFPVPFETMRADVEFNQLQEGCELQIGGVCVRAIRQQHPGDSWGYRFEQQDKVIVYSSDSEHKEDYKCPNSPFVEFFKHADILIFDGQYSPEDSTNAKRSWGHSDYITAIELAAHAQVRQLCLFHHEPRNSDEEIEALHQSALEYNKQFNQLHTTEALQTYPIAISLAYDGLTLEA